MEKLNLVLIIDDNAIAQFITRKVVEETNLAKEIICFEDAGNALSFLKDCYNKFPALIMLDVHMPGIDGYQFLEEYKSLESEVKKHIKICMLTSSLNVKEKNFFLSKHSVCDYVTKPLTPEKLNSILKKMHL